jgi:hypothetical protein
VTLHPCGHVLCAGCHRTSPPAGPTGTGVTCATCGTISEMSLPNPVLTSLVVRAAFKAQLVEAMRTALAALADVFESAQRAPALPAQPLLPNAMSRGPSKASLSSLADSANGSTFSKGSSSPPLIGVTPRELAQSPQMANSAITLDSGQSLVVGGAAQAAVRRMLDQRPSQTQLDPLKRK